jgi:hypothetical protein
LGYNRINIIDDDSFGDLVNLNDLWLGDKKTEIREETFKGLASLKYLYIVSNSINSIDDNTFSDLINLNDLRLDYNEFII